MTVDEVVAEIKADFVAWGTGVAMTALVSAFPGVMGVGFVAALAKYLINFVLSAIAKEMDFATYFVFKSIQNNVIAAQYEDAIRVSIKAAEQGDPDEIKKSRDAQVAAFSRVWALS